MTRIRKVLVWLFIGMLAALLVIASLPFMLLATPVLLLVGLIFILMPEPEQEGADSALLPQRSPRELLRVSRPLRTLDR